MSTIALNSIGDGSTFRVGDDPEILTMVGHPDFDENSSMARIYVRDTLAAQPVHTRKIVLNVAETSFYCGECDGTGYTGKTGGICPAHYQPCDTIGYMR